MVLPPNLPPGLPPMPPGPPMGPPPGPPAPPPPQLPPPIPTATPREERKMARLRPYELPEPPEKTPRRPSKKFILEQKKSRMEYWRERNDEMDRDLALYMMDGAVEVKTTGKGGEEVIRRITPHAMVDKVANMVSKQKDRIRIIPRAQNKEYEEAAQNIEDFLYDNRRQINAKHTAKLNQAIGHDETWYLAGLGWGASRHYLDPGAEWPICTDLYDPRRCYPGVGTTGVGQLPDMLFVEETDKITFLAANPKLTDKAAIRKLEDDARVEVVWYENSHCSVIMVNDDVVDSYEHGYGFCPWVAAIAGGSPLRDKRSRRMFGKGLLRALRHMMEYDNRLHSQIATIVARAANPAWIMTYDSTKGGKQKEIDNRPGVTNYMDVSKGETAQPLGATERPDQVAMMVEMIRQDISRGGIQSMLWDDNPSFNSGFQFSVMRTNAEDVLQPITSALVQWRQWQNRMALNLILVAEREGLLDPTTAAQEGEEYTTGVLYRRPNRTAGASAYGSREASHVYSVLEPESIHLNGVDNEVLLSNMTPQDMSQNIQTAAMGVQAKLFSRKYALEHILNFDDFEAEHLRLVYEAGLIDNPDMLQNYAWPMAARYIDPEAYAYYRQQQMQQFQQQQAAAQAAAAQPPPPRPGLDSTVLPPDMQSVTGIPGAGDALSQDADLAAMLQVLSNGGTI